MQKRDFPGPVPPPFEMCAVHRYPPDARRFNRSGLKGSWDQERAGKRMKLKEPETWERLLSLEGNKAATWQKLLGVRAARKHFCTQIKMKDQTY